MRASGRKPRYRDKTYRRSQGDGGVLHWGDMERDNELEERIRLGRAVFAQQFAKCFWFLRQDLEISAETLPVLAQALRRYGDKEDFRTAHKLCPSRNSKS